MAFLEVEGIPIIGSIIHLKINNKRILAFIEQTFVEVLLWARLCPSLWDYGNNKMVKKMLPGWKVPSCEEKQTIKQVSCMIR